MVFFQLCSSIALPYSSPSLICWDPVYKMCHSAWLENPQDHSNIQKRRSVQCKKITGPIHSFVSVKATRGHCFQKYHWLFPPLISSQQFGFMKNRSCLSQHLIYLVKIYHSVNCKARTDAIYVYLKRAFDPVPHNELLLKLWSQEITGPLLMWFKSIYWTISILFILT